MVVEARKDIEKEILGEQELHTSAEKGFRVRVCDAAGGEKGVGRLGFPCRTVVHVYPVRAKVGVEEPFDSGRGIPEELGIAFSNPGGKLGSAEERERHLKPCRLAPNKKTCIAAQGGAEKKIDPCRGEVEVESGLHLVRRARCDLQ